MSMASRVGTTIRAALVIVSALLIGIATMASAQASTPAKEAGRQVVRTDGKKAQPLADSPKAAQAVYFCYPPFRYRNAAEWNCTVNSGAIQFWITCSVGGTYYSAPHGPGSYFVRAVCPQGIRLSEGVRAVA